MVYFINGLLINKYIAGFDCITGVAGDGFVYIICPLPISSGINSLKVKVQYLVGYPFPIDALFGPRAKKICRVKQKKICWFYAFFVFLG